jgi:hypothetical protein
MIDERDIREMLQRRADAISAWPSDAPAAVRRGRRRIAATLVLSIATAAVLLIGAVAGVRSLLRATPRPAVPDQEQILPDSAESWSRGPSPLDGPTTVGTVGEEGNRVHAITAGGPGLVAVGAEDGEATIWTSADGRGWTRVEQTSETTAFLDVTAGGPGLVAVALGNHGWTTQTGDGAPIWTSADGSTWTRAPSDAVFEGAWIRAVIAGGPGLVAVGSDLDGPRAWISSDGVSWQEASVPAMPANVAFDGKHADAWMQDVATDGERLVAVGTIGVSCGQTCGRYGPAVWTSTDGRTWSALPAGPVFPPNPTDVEVRSVTAGPTGFVIVGGIFSDEPWIWASPDGLAWHRVAPEQDAFVSRSSGRGDGSDSLYFEIQAVAAGGGGYVAVGGDAWCVYSRWDCPRAEAAVWTSPDGEAWHRVPSAPVFQFGRSGRASGGALAAWGSRFVVTSAYTHPCDACESGMAVWISEPPRGG